MGNYLDRAGVVELTGLIKGKCDDTYVSKLDNDYLSTSGGTLTGDLTIKKGYNEKPGIVFQRAETNDTYEDWKIVNDGGYLKIQNRNQSNSFADVLTLTPRSALQIKAGSTDLNYKFVGDLTGNADTATTATTLSNTLGVGKGGTGKTSAIDACNSFLNALDVGSANPRDNDYFISQYVDGGTTITTYHRRPISTLWNYIKGKADNTYSKLDHSHSDYVNQNAFSNVVVGSTTIAADTATDTLTLEAGANITLTANATNDKITIAGTNNTSHTHAAGTGLSKSGSDGTSGGVLTYSLKTAATGEIGGIKASNVLSSAVTLTSSNGSTSGRYYGVQVDNGGKAFVNVPWTDTNTCHVSTTSANTAAIAGWYRIAKTDTNIGNNSGTFYIVAADGNNGWHTACTVVAGISYGISASTTLSQLSCSHYNDCGITKVRIVYHTSFRGNYAYLEVYVPTDTKRNISVKFLGHGWQLVSPSTVEVSIPSGYTTRSISLSNGGSIASGLTMYSGHLATSADRLPADYPYGLTIYPVYNQGFPELYGNVFNIYGGGCNQMFLTWSGSQLDGTAEDVPSNLYLRSNRDNQTKWSTWTRVLTDKRYLDMENWTYQTTVSISNMVPNKLYRYSAACTSVTISSFKAGIPDAYNEYMLEFYTGANCVISVPSSVKWAFSTPKLRTNKWYQVSIVNNLGVWAEFG